MMEVTRAERATADMKVARQNAEVLGAGVDVGGVTDAGFEFTEEDRITTVGLHREKLDPSTLNGQLLPAGGVGPRQETQAIRDIARQWRLAGSGARILRLNALQHLSLEGGRRRLRRQVQNHAFHGALQEPQQFPKLVVGARLLSKPALLISAEESQHVKGGLFLLLLGNHALALKLPRNLKRPRRMRALMVPKGSLRASAICWPRAPTA